MRTLRRQTSIMPHAFALLVALALAPGAATAQSVLLQEDGLVPDTDWTITSLGNPAASGTETIAIGGNASTPGGETLSFYAGNPGCPVPGRGVGLCLLRNEMTIGDYEQTSFESFWGIGDAGEIAYSPIANNTVTQSTGLDGVWLDDAGVAVEEEVYQNDNSFYWSFGSRPTVTANGVPYWVGGITDTQGGSTQNRGLFMGVGATPLVIGGGMITGLPDPVSPASSGISFDYRVSRLGSHWIAEVGTETGSTNTDNSIVIDGAVALSDGMPVSEGTMIPAASGGLNGEAWDNFDFAGITESGTWMITGDTGGDIATDEFVAIDGVIVVREGDTVDGAVITGAMEGAYLNEDGDYAYVWDVVPDGGGSVEALFFNDQLLLVEGDPVDWDNDGTIDLDTAIDGFVGISTVAMTDRDELGRVVILCTVDVSVPIVNGRGTEVLEGFLSVPVSTAPVAVGEPNALDLVALRATPSIITGAGDVTFEATLPSGSASLTVYDVTGRRVTSIFSGTLDPGAHRFVWDGRGESGAAITSGVYWAKLESAGGDAVTRVTRLR